MFLLLVALTLAPLALIMLDMTRANAPDPIVDALLVLTLVLLVPIVMSFWTAILGFFVELRGGDRLAPENVDLDDVDEPLSATTAILMPIYDEDPARLVANLATTYASLERNGHLGAFEFFVLSDTMDPDRWIQEEFAVARFRSTVSDPARVQYRNRVRNTAKKAGNIADFCREHAGRHRYMIVFDADSLMSGGTLVKLVRLMERHPEVGILQAPPVPVNRNTLFGRLQQFAARAYGPTWAAGLSFLQGGEGNYYGHNAILRVSAFVRHCDLPVLPGKAPLGGFILSHDFIEAAMMRRAGYKVHLASGVGSSFEEPPATLIDYEVRDRRWCQGNLQHARLLGLPGLHPISRIHLMLGVMSFVASPIWFLVLLLSTAEALNRSLGVHRYFAGEALFPIWEVSIRQQASMLFGAVMLILFLPRALALVSRMREDGGRLFGGRDGLAQSGLFETLFSSLLAPLLAASQARSVVSTLLGRDAGWKVGPRGEHGTRFREAARRHGWVTVLGCLWAGVLLRFSPELFWWMLPVLAGLVLAIPLSILTSRVSAGEWTRRRGLLRTPEEESPPAILRLHRSEVRRWAGVANPAPGRSALERVLGESSLRAAHLEFAARSTPEDPLERHAVDGLVLKCRLQGPHKLNKEEQRTVLLSVDAVLSLLRLPGANGILSDPSGSTGG